MNIKKVLLLAIIFVIFSGNTSLDRNLIVAISKGDFLKVKSLVESGASVNAIYHKGKSALHWAVSGGNFKIAAYLIYKGAKIDATDETGATPLQLAAMGRNLDIVKLLVQSGANLNHIDKNGWDVLHYYTYYEFGLGIKYLLTQGISITNLTKRKHMDIPAGYKALDIAIRKKYDDIVSILENPVKYTSLSQKPIILYSFSGLLGEDSALSTLERGFIVVNITNIGGVEIRDLKFELIGVSNTDDIEYEKVKFLSLSSGEAKEVTFNIKGLNSLTNSGNAFFELKMIDSEKTNVNKFFIKKIYKPIPDPFVMALFNYPFQIITGSSTNIVFRVENRGKGNLENANLRIQFFNTNLVNQLFEFTNINIKALTFKDFNIELATYENLLIKYPENVRASVIFSYSIGEITNYFEFKILPYPLPELVFYYGIDENAFKNIYLIDKNHTNLAFYLSNKGATGSDIDINIETFSAETNLLKYNFVFPSNSVVNFYLEDFNTNENIKKVKISGFYKTKIFFEKILFFTNYNYQPTIILTGTNILLTNNREEQTDKIKGDFEK